MKYKCQENEGNTMDIDYQDGELMITIYSVEMRCELVMCLSQEESEKFKADVNRSI